MTEGYGPLAIEPSQSELISIDSAPLKRIRAVTHERSADDGRGGLVKNEVQAFDYEYDSEGQLTKISHRSAANVYEQVLSYDLTVQVTAVTASGTARNESFSYDDAGNRISDDGTPSYVIGDANRIQSGGDWTYSYDDERNMVGKSKASSNESWTYVYDHRNRLTSYSDNTGVNVTPLGTDTDLIQDRGVEVDVLLCIDTDNQTITN